MYNNINLVDWASWIFNKARQCLCWSLLLVVFGKPLVTLIRSHGLWKQPNRRHMNAVWKWIYLILYNVLRLITSSSNSFPFGSAEDSCLNASSPTKQISWPSYIKQNMTQPRKYSRSISVRLDNKDSQDLQEWRLPPWLFQVCPDSQEGLGFSAFLFSLTLQCLVTAKQRHFCKITPSRMDIVGWCWHSWPDPVGKRMRSFQKQSHDPQRLRCPVTPAYTTQAHNLLKQHINYRSTVWGW